MYEVQNVRGDGTKQDMIDKHKLHVWPCVSKVAASEHLANAVKDGKFDIETFVVPSICTACYLQTVKDSTGAETHELIEAEMQSIGSPSRPSLESHLQVVAQSALQLTIFKITKGQTMWADCAQLRQTSKNVLLCVN